MLVVELLALQRELVRLNLEQLCLLPGQFLLVGDLTLDGADFLRLLAEGEDREGGSDDREQGEGVVAIAVISLDKSADMDGWL